jgi:hypothetical protein
VTTRKVNYGIVTKREPWQPTCDKCGVLLKRPFYYTGERPTSYRTICRTCHEKGIWRRIIGAAFYGPEPKDPRYE